MKKQFYSGPKIEIGQDHIKIKEQNIRLNYKDIKSIGIKNTRLSRKWLLYLVTGVLAFIVILGIFFLFIRGSIDDQAHVPGSGFYNRKHSISLLMFIFIGGPLVILFKVKKYFRKHIMLVIKWENADFRIKISDMGIDANELKMFLERKIESSKAPSLLLPPSQKGRY